MVGVASAAVLIAGYASFVATVGLWLSVRCANSVRAVLFFLAIVLGTIVVPIFSAPVIDSLLGLGWGWSEGIDLFSPPFGIWHATEWTLTEPVRSSRSTDSTSFAPASAAIIGLVYFAAASVIWVSALRRFDRDGR